MIALFIKITLIFFIACLVMLFLSHQLYTHGQKSYRQNDLYGFCPQNKGYGYWYKPVTGRRLINNEWRWFYGQQFIELMTEQEYKSCVSQWRCPYC